MYIRRLQLEPYGAFSSLEIELGEGLTVVVGANEAGKSTALRALNDLIFGIPRQTDMAHSFVRKELTVMAQVTMGGDVVEIKRTAEGLSSGTKQLPSPWGVEGVEPTDGGAWWLARFGIDHTRLRRGGREVMNGGGDIGELIFAATEGTSARQLRQTVEEEANKIWKPRGQKLRLSEAVNTFRKTKEGLAERQARSAQVAQAEREVAAAAKALAVAEQDLLDADREQRRSEEDSRAIRHTLKYLAAQVELTKIDREGPRVDAQQLEQWEKARKDIDDNAPKFAKLAGEIADLEQRLAELPNRPALLADGESIKELAANFPVVRAALERASEQHDPKVKELEDRLRRLLASVRMTADDLDSALEQVLVDAERRAELNHQVAVLDRLGEVLLREEEDIDGAIKVLAERSLVLDPDTAEAVDAQALKDARESVRSADNELRRVNNRISDLLGQEEEHNAAAKVASFQPRFGEDELKQARVARDAAWAELRKAWLTDEPTDKANRLAMADGLDAAQHNADRVSDQVADDRTEQVRQQTRGEMLDQFLKQVREDIDEDSKALGEARTERDQAVQRWIDSWAPARLNAQPAFDDLEAVVPAIAKIVNARRRIADVKADIDASEQKWGDTCKQFGLGEQLTPAMWTERESALSAIDMAAAEREKERLASTREMQSWEAYLERLRPMAEKHEIDWPTDPDVDSVSAAVASLSKAANEATNDERDRKDWQYKLDGKKHEKAEVSGLLQRAQETIDAIRAIHDDRDEVEMDELIDRARRAIKQESLRDDAARDLKSALTPGSRIEEVVERLRNEDEASVKRNEATRKEARGAAQVRRDQAFEQSRARQQELDELTGRGGAVEALADLERDREIVARLAQQWAQHQLEILMIDKVLERLGSEQSSDLLAHAGEILEQITDGAWVALQIKESGERRTLMVVRADEKRFDTGELSEGTADAVYLALRLAAVARHHRQRVEADRPVFPLVLDDALITLDDPRASGVLRALSTLAEGLQAVVFTHHPHLGYLASDMPGVQVTSIPEPLGKSDAGDPAAIRERAKVPLFEAPRRPSEARSALRKEEPQAIREWAREQGYTVGDKGRIPQPVREAYEAAHAL